MCKMSFIILKCFKWHIKCMQKIILKYMRNSVHCYKRNPSILTHSCHKIDTKPSSLPCSSLSPFLFITNKYLLFVINILRHNKSVNFTDTNTDTETHRHTHTHTVKDDTLPKQAYV